MTDKPIQLDPSDFTKPEISRLPEAMRSDTPPPLPFGAMPLPCSREVDPIAEMSWDDLASLDDSAEMPNAADGGDGSAFSPPLSNFVAEIAQIQNILKKVAADELFAAIDEDEGVVEIYNPMFSDPVARFPQKLYLDL
jgi:hypothetical protein